MANTTQPRKAHPSVASMLLEDAGKAPIVLVTIASVVLILLVFGLGGML